MKLNKLDFQVIKEKLSQELSFELIIDDVPLGQLLRTDDNKIPCWYFEKAELPSFYSDYQEKTLYVLGICSCGESGCGCVGCEMVKDEEFVVLEQIFNDGFRHKEDLKFKFSRMHYDEVIQKIFELAQEFKNQCNQTE